MKTQRVCTGLGGLWGHKFDMGMTEVLKCEGFRGHCLGPHSSKGLKNTLNVFFGLFCFFENVKMHKVSCKG